MDASPNAPCIKEESMNALVNRLVRDEEGQDLIEYALLAALIALACTVALGLVAGGINNLFNDIVNKLKPPPA